MEAVDGKEFWMLAFFRHNTEKVSYLFVLFTLFVFSILILWNANWVFGMFWADDYQFVSTTAVGKPSRAWTGFGRFWPLGLCDYSLLLAIPYGTSEIVHFAYNCITMIVASLFFFSYLKKLSGNSSYAPVFCMFILFSLSSFILIHISCIYPERQMFLMLSLFLFFYWKATRESHKTFDYVVAFIAAAYTTYLKEPVFGLWIVFAFFNIVLGKLSDKNRKFNYALILNSTIWIVIYLYRTLFKDRSLIERKSVYANLSFHLSDMFENFVKFFNLEPILYLLLVIAVIRFTIVLKNRSRYDFNTDSLLFAGLGYVFAYVIIDRQANHYCFPSVLLGLPAFAVTLSSFKRSYVKYIFVCLAILSSSYSMRQSIAWVNEIMQHRCADPQMFFRLINESRDGKQIFWITEKGKEAITKENSREIDHMKFRRYQIFFDYYGGCHTGQHFPLFKVSDYSKINENAIVLCSDETLTSRYYTAIDAQIKKAGLHLSHSNDDLGVKIFEKK